MSKRSPTTCRKAQGPPRRALQADCTFLRLLPSLRSDDLHLDLRAAREVLPGLRPGVDLDQVVAGLEPARRLGLPGDRDAAALLDLLELLHVLAGADLARLLLLALARGHEAVHPHAHPAGRARHGGLELDPVAAHLLERHATADAQAEHRRRGPALAGVARVAVALAGHGLAGAGHDQVAQVADQRGLRDAAQAGQRLDRAAGVRHDPHEAPEAGLGERAADVAVVVVADAARPAAGTAGDVDVQRLPRPDRTRGVLLAVRHVRVDGERLAPEVEVVDLLAARSADRVDLDGVAAVGPQDQALGRVAVRLGAEHRRVVVAAARGQVVDRHRVLDGRRVRHEVRPDLRLVLRQDRGEVAVRRPARHVDVDLGADVLGRPALGVEERRAARGDDDGAVHPLLAGVGATEVADRRAAQLDRVRVEAVRAGLARGDRLLRVEAGVHTRRRDVAVELGHVERAAAHGHAVGE